MKSFFYIDYAKKQRTYFFSIVVEIRKLAIQFILSLVLWSLLRSSWSNIWIAFDAQRESKLLNIFDKSIFFYLGNSKISPFTSLDSSEYMSSNFEPYLTMIFVLFGLYWWLNFKFINHLRYLPLKSWMQMPGEKYGINRNEIVELITFKSTWPDPGQTFANCKKLFQQ